VVVSIGADVFGKVAGDADAELWPLICELRSFVASAFGGQTLLRMTTREKRAARFGKRALQPQAAGFEKVNQKISFRANWI
jgi:hypothetical protein